MGKLNKDDIKIAYASLVNKKCMDRLNSIYKLKEEHYARSLNSIDFASLDMYYLFPTSYEIDFKVSYTVFSDIRKRGAFSESLDILKRGYNNELEYVFKCKETGESCTLSDFVSSVKQRKLSFVDKLPSCSVIDYVSKIYNVPFEVPEYILESTLNLNYAIGECSPIDTLLTSDSKSDGYEKILESMGLPETFTSLDLATFFYYVLNISGLVDPGKGAHSKVSKLNPLEVSISNSLVSEVLVTPSVNVGKSNLVLKSEEPLRKHLIKSLFSTVELSNLLGIGQTWLTNIKIPRSFMVDMAKLLRSHKSEKGFKDSDIGMLFMFGVLLYAFKKEYISSRKLFGSAVNKIVKLDAQQSAQIKNAKIEGMNKQKSGSINEKYLAELKSVRDENFNLNVKLESANESLYQSSVKIRKLEKEIEKLKMDSEDLPFLRDYYYSVSNDNVCNFDLSVQEVDCDLSDIQSVKGVFIGGHHSIRSRLSTYLPSFTFVDSSIQTFDMSALLNADVVCFFPWFNKHSTFSKVIDKVRTHNIPIVYLGRITNTNLLLKDIRNRVTLVLNDQE